jgi:hypothetical protein
MPAPFPRCIVPLGLGITVVLVAAAAGSLPWFAFGALAIACGVIDALRLLGMPLRGVVADAIECLVAIAVLLVLCLFKPSDSDAPHELD